MDEEKQKLLATRERLEKMGWWLDSCLRVPGTPLRFGLDPLIGLVPVAGDIVGLALSLWVIREAHRCGAPRRLMWKMGGNAALDAGAGFLPLVGDLFDFLFKANRRNAALLREHLDLQLQPRQPRSRWLTMCGLLVLAGGAWWFQHNGFHFLPP